MKQLLSIAVCATAGLAAGQGAAQTSDLRGEQVVNLQCVKCHQAGVNGAPKIGDREAWIPRLKQGIDPLVRAAVRGHGSMPARGGMAQLTDGEFRSAVLYMINGRESVPGAVAQPAARDPHRKVVEGIEFDLGVTPKGGGTYHLNVSLLDTATKKVLKAASVEARVASALTGQTRKLEATEVNGMTGYGGDFRMPGKDLYTITVLVRTKGDARPIETRFEFAP
ncbi:MAG TPA: c-type cytochrome [Burkholderiales bacterium]